MVEILPLVDEPVLTVEDNIKILVISDIHLGIERDLRRSGVNIPSQTGKLVAKILSLVRLLKPDKVIILGDLKHNIPWTSRQERDEIPLFLERLAEEATVDITMGNHDGNLDQLIPNSRDITLHKAQGFLLGDVGYFHGHAWPSKDLFKADYILMGHNHPIVKLTDSLGYFKPMRVWLRAKFDREVILSHYGEMEYKDPLLVMVPAFNRLCGGISVNTESGSLLGPLLTSNAVDIDTADVYLINGTYIGDVRTVQYQL
ncbi:MAG: metallophosphoesterase [Halobacteriota archaeon]|nr:metallophosphoesterase [Halobacteriota archaeon]